MFNKKSILIQLFLVLLSVALSARVLIMDHFNGIKKENYCLIKNMSSTPMQLIVLPKENFLKHQVTTKNKSLSLDKRVRYTFEEPLPMRCGGIAFWINMQKELSHDSYKQFGYPIIFREKLKDGFIQIYLYYNSKYDEWILNCLFCGEGKKVSSVNCRIAGSLKKRFLKNLYNKEKWKKDQWHHVTLCWNMDSIKLFLDGVEVSKGKTIPSSFELTGFSFGTDKGFPMAIDEMIIFDEPDDVQPIVKAAKNRKKLSIESFKKTSEETSQSKKQAGYYVPFISSPPVIDGNVLNDPAWKKMPKSFVLGTNDFNHSPVFPPTIWGIAHDGKYVYVSALCYEPDMKDLHSSKHGKDIWGDDAIELFFVVNDEILQFVANPGTGRLDAKGRRGKDWDCPDWTTAARKAQNYWSIEFKIPLDVVRTKKDVSKFNFARDFLAGNHSAMKYASWSYLMGSSFFKKARYNRIIWGREGDAGDFSAWNNSNTSFAEKFKNDLLHRYLNLNKVFQLVNTVKDADQYKGLTRRFEQISRKLNQDNNSEQVNYASIKSLIKNWMAIKEIEDKTKEIVASIQKSIIKRYSCHKFPGVTSGKIVETKKYFYLNAGKAIYAVNKSNGILCAAWNSDGEKIVDLVYDSYIIESRKSDASEFFELNDKLLKFKIKKAQDKTILSLTCSNTGIPGLITKNYIIESDSRTRLSKRIEISDVKQQELLLSVISNTNITPMYRSNSIYNRYIANGTNPTLYSANKIKDELKISFTTGWPTTSGWAQWLLINPEKHSLFSQYLWKVNDKIAFPPISPVETYLTTSGWKLPYFTNFLDPSGNGVSAETSFDFYEGNRVSYYSKKYLGRRELKKLYDKYPVAEKAKKLRHGISSVNFHSRWRARRNPNLLPHEKAAWKEFMKYTRSDEGGVNCNMHWSIHHPDYAVGDDKQVTAGILEHNDGKYFKIDSKFIRDCIRSTHEFTHNRSKVALYTYHAEVFSPQERAKENWYTHLKSGKRIHSSWCESLFIANTAAIVESGKYQSDAEGLYRYLGMDSLYIDGYPALPLTVDWKTLKVTSPNYITELSLELEKIASKYHGFNFYNSGGLLIPGQDVAYMEGADQRNCKYKWHEASDAFLLSQISRRRYLPIIPLVWHADLQKSDNISSNHHYLNNLILFGWLCSAPVAGKNTRKKYYGNGWLPIQKMGVKVSEIGVDMSALKLTDIGMIPCWWKDWNKTLESYSYDMGNSSLITFVNHSKRKNNVKFSVSIKKASIDKRKPVYIHLFKPILASELLVPFKLLRSNWFIKDLFSTKVISDYRISGDRLSFNLPEVPPETACVVTISQVPAYIFASEKINTEISLPEQIGAKIEYLNQTGNTISLKIDSDKPAHIAIPGFDEKSTVKVNDVSVNTASLGISIISGKPTLIVSIDKGLSRIDISHTNKAFNAAYSNIKAELSTRDISAGGTMPVEAIYNFQNSDNKKKFVSLYLSRDGIIRYCQTLPITKNSGKIKFNLDTYKVQNELKTPLDFVKPREYRVEIAVSSEGSAFNAPIIRKTIGNITIKY